MLNKKNIPIEDIKTISTDSVIVLSLFFSISNELQLEDTVWMKKNPIKRVGIGGYLCGHNIFIHINSKEIEKVVKEIDLKQKELEKIEIDSENGDEIDNEIWKIVEKLNGQKVVIVSECSD